ncbi:MAG TPA: type II and III secretion system protein family protein [Xanthobacteraceae bacterium]|nr:type II and III secretion system protein family protein [Xanthobacteraceae bacterium]
MSSKAGRHVASWGRRQSDGTTEAGRGAGEGWLTGGRPLVTRAVAVLAIAALVLPPCAIKPAQAQRLISISAAKRTASVMIAVGKTEDIRVDAPFTDITVGDPEVADVTPLTDHSLSVLGKKIGTTRVSIYGEGKRLVGLFDVEVSYDISRLSVEIRRITGGGIKVSSVNGRIMLSGTSHDAVTLDKAVVIARQFAPDIINTVQVLQPQQVMLEVRFVEASRAAGRELGVQWNSFGKNTLTNIGSRVEAGQLPVTTPGGPFQQPPYKFPPNQLGGKNIVDSTIPISPIVAAGVLSGTAPFGFLLGSMNRGALSIDVAINALEQKGLIRSLAEPNLVALSGDTASFLAGGEYPIPVPGGLGTVTIEYKKYGVGLAFTPTVLRDGLINLKIVPEVSELDISHPIQFLGYSIPPLTVRTASTTVELRDGQSFVIGGLLQNKSTTAQQQLPWLGDVPVLGALFSSKRYQKDETDLAIIVTPRIVRPSRPGDPVKTPLDNTLPANDIDFFLMGKAEITPAEARLAAGHQRRFMGHILDLRKEGANVVAVKN